MNTDTHLLNKMFRGVLITNAISIAAGIVCVMIDGIITGQFLGADAVAASGLLHKPPGRTAGRGRHHVYPLSG